MVGDGQMQPAIDRTFGVRGKGRPWGSDPTKPLAFCLDLNSVNLLRRAGKVDVVKLISQFRKRRGRRWTKEK